MGAWLFRHRLAATGGAFAAVAVAVAAGGLAVAAESATVDVTVPAQQVEIVSELKTVPVRHVQVQINDSTTVTASSVNVAATYATGTVIVTVSYNPNPIVPCPYGSMIPASTFVWAYGGTYFATQEAAPLSSQVTIPIRAVAPGSSGNQAAGAVRNILKIGYLAYCDISVTNPSPITGGADSYSVPVFQQADLDAAQAALEAKLAPELRMSLAAKTAGMTFVADKTPTFSVTADHGVGDRTPTATVSASGELGAGAFTNADAERALRDALQHRVLPGYRLRDPIQEQFVFMAGSQPGQLAVWGHGVAFAIPAMSKSSIAKQLAGAGMSDAVLRLEREFPGSSIVIGTGPLPAEWLPVLSSRINVEVTVGPTIL